MQIQPLDTISCDSHHYIVQNLKGFLTKTLLNMRSKVDAKYNRKLGSTCVRLFWMLWMWVTFSNHWSNAEIFLACGKWQKSFVGIWQQYIADRDPMHIQHLAFVSDFYAELWFCHWGTIEYVRHRQILTFSLSSLWWCWIWWQKQVEHDDCNRLENVTGMGVHAIL